MIFSDRKKFLMPAIIIVICAMLFTAPGARAESTDTASNSSLSSTNEASDIDFYSLEELLNVTVNVASLFVEDELVIGSTVSKIDSTKWKQLGARRFHEVFNNETSVQATPNIGGAYNIAIRGYSNTESREGVAAIIDGIPVNDLTSGSAFIAMPNCELGILDSIELIKGPGSAIYGSDAFQGVISMRTFESDTNHYSIEGAGAYPLYGDGNVKISQGIGDSVRIDAAASISRQGDQDLEYEYKDGSGREKKASFKYEFDSRAGMFKAKIKPADKLTVRIGTYAMYYECDDYPGISKSSRMPLYDQDYSEGNSTYYMGNAGASYELPHSIIMEAMGYLKRSMVKVDVNATSAITLHQEATGDHFGGQLSVKQQDNPINLQWFAAYSYAYGKINEYNVDLISSGVSSPQLNPAEGYDIGIHSIFSQLKWGAIKNSLYFLLGCRLDNYTQWGNQISPRAGIILLPARNSSIKVLYGRAFKAPTQVHLYGMQPWIYGYSKIEPEKMDVYELIYIYKRHDFKLNITGFYSQWKDAIVVVRNPPAPDNFRNSGKRDSYGLEFSMIYEFKPFMIDTGLSYIKSRAIDAQDPDNWTDSENMDYGIFPEYSINAGLTYTLQRYDLTFYLNNRIYLNVMEANKDIDTHKEKLPPYYRIDLNIYKAFSTSVEFYLDIRNLLNRENRTPSVYGIDDGYLEPGISVMLRAGYKL